MFLLGYSVVQYSSRVKQAYYRYDFLMLFTTIGSIMYACRRLSTRIVTNVTDNILDKDMMPKLYSINKEKGDSL